ncbi:MAG: DUF4197 domain-containing protein [Gammaproteobacteria bacterium]|nr:DUF4197 domain-containing protein [Gammaproteobacteria bacterium]NIR84594.1 DUF4197 domain-containing protein [Gammaproteobacteria bacterium]NIR90497.1 DUF4197 domain-containing protein [Gammaproteobacteria bacterium]NIU05645.1 DUF4197 domain-containing protein [Gammaproteobacteria bacterium]NIV52784.1 DUF4197 family protein [Gammaproteobacteria bacterium]
MRKVLVLFLVCLLAPPVLFAQTDWLRKGQELLRGLGADSGASESLTTAQIRDGLKEALRVGTARVVDRLGRVDGFNADPQVHIPLPGSLRRMRSALDKVGMASLLDDLELKLNRAAETATPKAKALFWDAIGNMTIADVQAIYNGPDDAATRYFEGKMSGPLAEEMRPIVEQSLSEVGAVRAYDEAVAQYKTIPFVPDVRADLTEHVLDKGIAGVFHYLAREEAAIRRDPAKRTSEVLRRVFGAS